MNIIDMKTLILNQVLAYAVCMIVAGLLWQQNRRRFQGVGLWLACFVMQTISIVLIALRGIIPNWLSIVFGGSAVPISATILLYVGLEEFVGRRTRQYHNVLLLIVSGAIHAYFAFVQPGLAARNINFSIAAIILYAQIAWLMLYRVSPEMRPMTGTIGWVFIAFSLVSVGRIFFNLTEPAGNDLLKANNTFDTVMFLAYQALFFAAAFGLFLMVNQRLFSELQTQQTALQKSEIRYRQLVEFSPDALFVFHDGKFALINPAAQRLMRAANPEQLIGKNVLDFVHPDYRSVAAGRITNVLTRGEHAPLLEEKFIRLDGTIIDAEVITVPLEYQGQPALQSIVRDITERKRTEAQLQTYQAQLIAQNLELRKLWLAIEQSGNTVVITDAQGAIQYANPRFEHTSGYLLSDVKGENPRFLKSGKQAGGFYRDLWQSITNGKIWHGELHNRRKDGTLYWESATIAPVQDDTGQVTNYIAIKEDITERKQLEASLERLATTDSLTGALNRRQLVAVADRELDRAHRYNHPTSVIMLDIDHFKKINDQYGHAIGDIAIQRTAQVLRENLRAVDYLGRYGGDEFTIVLPETDLVEAGKFAERIRARVEKQTIHGDEDQVVQLSISLGLVCVTSAADDPWASFDEAIQLADKALYSAKAAGRNRVCIA